jgi:hypothetical protein
LKWYNDFDEVEERRMPPTQYSHDEIARRGKEIYETQLRAKLEPEHTGKFLVVDIETGEYELDEDGNAASQRAYQKKPDGVRYGLRVGYRAWGRLGAGGKRVAR